MRAVPAQSGSTRVGVDGKLHPGPPPQPVTVARHRLDHRIKPERGQVEARETAELLAHDRGFEPPLLAKGDVLEVAATAYARVATGRNHPRRRGPHHRDGVGAQERAARLTLGDPGAHHLTRQGVSDKHDLPVKPRDAVPAMRDRANLELDELLTHRRAGHRRGREHRALAPSRQTRAAATGRSRGRLRA